MSRASCAGFDDENSRPRPLKAACSVSSTRCCLLLDGIGSPQFVACVISVGTETPGVWPKEMTYVFMC